MIKFDSIRSFQKVGDTLPIPNLIEIQRESYKRFLQTELSPRDRQRIGLEALLQEIFPIESYDGNMKLEYLGYELGKARYTSDECRQLRLTYGMPFRIHARLIRKDKDEIHEDLIYLGEMPIMIGGGEFIINGAERVIVSQLHRSPGVDFIKEQAEGDRALHACRIIPERGSWIEVNVTKKDILTVRIDQSSKIAATVFLRAMDERFGTSALIRLLGRYFEGEREQEAIPNALGVSRKQFFEEFVDWAATQVASWGLAAEPSMQVLLDELRMGDPKLAEQMQKSRLARLEVIVRRMTDQIGEPSRQRSRSLTGNDWPELARPKIEITDEQLDVWLAEYPDHPDLLEIRLRRRLKATNTVSDDILPMLERYVKLRPVDPFPHRKLAQYWLSSDMPEKAIPHLEILDISQEKNPVFTTRLAMLYRQNGEKKRALVKARRALHFDPYHAPSRELVAAIAIENSDFDLARRHIWALTIIEPDRPQHQRRLDAIDKMLQSR
ncbi:MAG: hypothetical protein IIA33_10030 [Planctomycetes bacterium]|nr:hypothetical protein [Planctomycetota bacterium]